jgi:hypothetical protein
MKIRHLPHTLALAAFSVLLAASPAQAANGDGVGPVLVPNPVFDAKTYPGLGCQAHDGDQEVDLNHFATSSWFLQLPPLPAVLKGGTWNESAAARRVTCPIVRDNISNANGTFGAAAGANLGVNVWVNNQGAANALTCTLYSNNPWGTAVALNTASAAAGQQQLNLDVNASTAGSGHYSLQCTLPPQSSVFSYRVFEYLPTDQNN